jgi:hypothetical protein
MSDLTAIICAVLIAMPIASIADTLRRIEKRIKGEA